MAAEKIRREAICDAVKPSLLTFIKIKELPQIKQSSTKMDQLINFVFIKRMAKVIKPGDTILLFILCSYKYASL